MKLFLKIFGIIFLFCSLNACSFIIIKENKLDIPKTKNVNNLKLLKEPIKNIRSIKFKSNVYSQGENIFTLIECLNFLVEDFGVPIDYIKKKIYIEINGNRDKNFVQFKKDKKTVNVYLGEFCFKGDMKKYIVHELFHGYYQDLFKYNKDILYSKDGLNQNSKKGIEAWATYAQYRYVYRGLSNLEIKRKIIQKHSIKNSDVKKVEKKNFKEILEIFHENQAKAYAINTLPLFDQKHDANLLYYKISNKIYLKDLEIKSIKPDNAAIFSSVILTYFILFLTL